jgi:hypothetical protein
MPAQMIRFSQNHSITSKLRFRNQILQRSHWVNSRLDEFKRLSQCETPLDADNEHEKQLPNGI